MSERLLKGIGVSPGIAVGPAVVVRWTMPDVPHRVVPRSQVEKEVRRLRAAVRDVRRYIQALKAKAEDRAGVDEARIFDAQVLMLEDKQFLAGVADLIRENHLTAEKAFEFKALEVRDMWAASGSPRLKDRLADFTGVAVRVIEHLMHRGADELWEGITQPSVVVARELGPGLTVQLDREHVTGLVSEEGTRTSHAAILAHSIGIPAVFGVAGALERIGPSTMVVMDGTRGTVLLHPTPSEIAEARSREQRRRALAAQLEEVVDQPAVTTDGVRIVLRGNVDLPDEIRAAQRHRAEGVGLLRTEFLITGHSALPTERSEEHTSELQSRLHLVCRLLLEKKKKKTDVKKDGRKLDQAQATLNALAEIDETLGSRVAVYLNALILRCSYVPICLSTVHTAAR